jgi:2-polyprenyl-3-methyl-5-hydroxy-6-metoxy-1,4-benzoquinol methylase
MRDHPYPPAHNQATMTVLNAPREIRSRPVTRCRLCENAGKEMYTALSDRFFGAPGRWNFTRCVNPACGLWWLDPMPLAEDLPKAYETYCTHTDELSSPSVRRRLERVALRTMLTLMGIDREREQSRSLYLDQTPPGRLLEIGCGAGARLARLRNRGWDVVGQEVDSIAAEVARKTYDLTVVVAPVESAGFSENSFDAVATNHVIEHVIDPVKMLTESYRLLRPGGNLIVVTPNVDSYLHRHFGVCWRALDPPRHLHLFCPRTLRQAAECAGFRDVHCRTSAANAFSVATGSLFLKRNQPANSLVIQGVGLWWQLRARLAHVSDSFSGEECVLHARKP